MRLRPATAADADAVFDMLGRFVTSYAPDRAAFGRTFPGLISDERAFLRVAEDDGALSGYVLAVAFSTLFANGPVVQVEELFVEEERRGRAIGRRLMDETVEWARSLGASDVTVPTRRAGPYYEGLGFEKTAAYYHMVPR